jgi:hypothetical protein
MQVAGGDVLAVLLALSGRSDSQEGVEMAAIAAHEGQHIVDDRARGTSQATHAQDIQTERNAYRTQSYVNEGLKSPSAYGLWRPGIPDQERTDTVNSLADQSVAQDK